MLWSSIENLKLVPSFDLSLSQTFAHLRFPNIRSIQELLFVALPFVKIDVLNLFRCVFEQGTIFHAMQALCGNNHLSPYQILKPNIFRTDGVIKVLFCFVIN